jgi:hypothetical protein
MSKSKGGEFFKKYPIKVNIYKPRGTEFRENGVLKEISEEDLKKRIDRLSEHTTYLVIEDMGRIVQRADGRKMFLKKLKLEIRPIEDRYIYLTNKGKRITSIFAPTGYEWYPVRFDVDRSKLDVVPVEMMRWAVSDTEKDWERYKAKSGLLGKIAEYAFFVITALMIVILLYNFYTKGIPAINQAIAATANLIDKTAALRGCSQVIAPPV